MRAKISGFHIVILLESRQGRLVATCGPQHPAAENALRVVDVPEGFLDGPFARGIAEVAPRIAPAVKGGRSSCSIAIPRFPESLDRAQEQQYFS